MKYAHTIDMLFAYLIIKNVPRKLIIAVKMLNTLHCMLCIMHRVIGT